MPAARAAADSSPPVEKFCKYLKTGDRIFVGITPPAHCLTVKSLSFLLTGFLPVILLAVLFHLRRKK